MMMLEVKLGLSVSSILRFEDSTGDVRVGCLDSVVDVFASVTDAAAAVFCNRNCSSQSILSWT